MTLRQGFRDIEVWAESSTQRIDPEDNSLTPPLNISDGWPATFSADDGLTPRRRVFNEIYHRETAALVDIRSYGILPYDAAVDTKQGGCKQVAGVIYRALSNNGPSWPNTVESPLDVGQTTWEVISGTIEAPSALTEAPVVSTPRSGVLSIKWKCPLDGGSVITGFVLEWKTNAQAWSAATQVTGLTFAQHELTGLTNGTTYDIRVKSTNAQGDSGWSPEATGTPAATVPGQVASVVAVSN